MSCCRDTLGACMRRKLLPGSADAALKAAGKLPHLRLDHLSAARAEPILVLLGMGFDAYTTEGVACVT